MKDNVIHMFEWKSKKLREENGWHEPTGGNYWEDLAKTNAENIERVRKERERNNKGVLRSYRIKEPTND